MVERGDATYQVKNNKKNFSLGSFLSAVQKPKQKSNLVLPKSNLSEKV
jgi:hypothetical protein